MSEAVKLERHGAVAVLRLDDPERDERAFARREGRHGEKRSHSSSAMRACAP